MNGEFTGQVAQVPLDEVDDIYPQTYLGEPHTPGEKLASILFNGALGLMSQRADKAYRVSWEGGLRVPRGAQFCNLRRDEDPEVRRVVVNRDMSHVPNPEQKIYTGSEKLAMYISFCSGEDGATSPSQMA